MADDAHNSRWTKKWRVVILHANQANILFDLYITTNNNFGVHAKYGEVCAQPRKRYKIFGNYKWVSKSIQQIKQLIWGSCIYSHLIHGQLISHMITDAFLPTWHRFSILGIKFLVSEGLSSISSNLTPLPNTVTPKHIAALATWKRLPHCQLKC